MSVIVEGMQQNLQTAARFYTEVNDLVVKFSNKTATDIKKTIFLQHYWGEIIPGIPASPAECWVTMKAGNAHESAHIIFSHRRAWEMACSKGKLFQHIVNILEDARVERAISSMYPGTKLWIRYSNEYFFKNHKFNGSGLKGFLDGLLYYAVVGLVPEGMDDKVNKAIEDCMNYVDKARNAESTWDVLKYSEKILEIAKVFPEVESMEQPKGFSGSDNPMPAPKGGEDPRRVIKRKKKSFEKSGDTKDKAGGLTGKESEGKPTGGPSGEDSDKPEEKVAGSGKKEKPEEPDEPSGSEEEKSSDEPGEKPGESEEKPGEEPDEKSAGDKPEEEDEELDSPPEGEPDEPEAPGDESGDKQEDSETEVDGEIFDDPDGEPEEDGPEDDPEDEYSDNPDTIPDDDPELDEVLEAAETELHTIEVDAERKIKEAEEPEEVNYDKLAKEISKEEIHRGVRFKLGHKNPEPAYYQQLVKKLSGPIKSLVEEIRKSLEFRDSVPRRSLKKGRLDPGALWKIRVPSPEVFYRKEEPGDVPILAVDLQVDCSGSMAGEIIAPDGSRKSKMDAAREAAVVLHETCNQLKIQHSVVGFTSLDPGAIYVTHYRVVDWGEKDGAKIASLKYELENRDGYSIRIATGELEIRPEPVKLMIVLSDGMPADKEYPLNKAIADTIRAVRDAEKKGIKVIGIYFGDEGDIERAQQIYNYLVFCKDINSLPTILGRVLKKALLG